MKKLIITAVMLLGVTAASFAKDHMYFNNLVEANFTVKAVEGIKFKVTGANLLEKSVVEIKDQEGNVIYKEVMSSENFAKVYNFSSLQDGSYKIVLTSGEKSVVKPFEIQTEITRVASPSK